MISQDSGVNRLISWLSYLRLRIVLLDEFLTAIFSQNCNTFERSLQQEFCVCVQGPNSYSHRRRIGISFSTPIPGLNLVAEVGHKRHCGSWSQGGSLSFAAITHNLYEKRVNKFCKQLEMNYQFWYQSNAISGVKGHFLGLWLATKGRRNEFWHHFPLFLKSWMDTEGLRFLYIGSRHLRNPQMRFQRSVFSCTSNSSFQFIRQWRQSGFSCLFLPLHLLT